MKPHPLPSSSTPHLAASAPKLRFHPYSAVALIVAFSLGYSVSLLSCYSTCSRSASLAGSPATSITLTKSDNATVATVVSAPARPPAHDLLRFSTNCVAAIPATRVYQTVLDNLFDGVDPYLNFPPPDMAPLLRPAAERPRGWGSTGAVFHDLIAELRPAVIIELGTFLGASALHMSAVAANLSLSPPPVILCVDDFRGWPGSQQRFHRQVPDGLHGEGFLLQQFMANAAAAASSTTGARLVPVPFSTASALQALCEWGVQADLIEVDAGHDFHSAWADINRAWAVLRPGGVMFGHDYFTKADDHGVRRAVTLFARLNGLRVRPHGQHWVLSPKPGAGSGKQ